MGTFPLQSGAPKSIIKSQLLLGIKPRLVVVIQTAAAFLFHLLTSGIPGLDCRVFCGPPPNTSQLLLGGLNMLQGRVGY